MPRFSQSSSIDYIGDARDPDIVYYNASIINNTTDDTNLADAAIYDPPIKFNETRDTAIIKDASKYQFSIVRFVVNGGNKDLPLFIPAIQSGTGQTDVNLTEYAVAITYSGTDRNVVSFGSNEVNATTPGLTYVEYVPETLNTVLAPLPRSTAAPTYAGVWSNLVVYNPGQIVFAADGFYYVCNPIVFSGGVPLNPPVANQNPLTTPLYWSVTSGELGQSQDLSSRYYWVYTYSHWVSLVQDALERANLACYTAWVAAGGVAPYTSYNAPGSPTSWVATNPTPVMSWSSDNLFSITYPPSYLTPAQQTEAGYTPVSTAPQMCLYFNTNMEGLFANFDNVYYNTTSPLWTPAAPGGGLGTPVQRWTYGTAPNYPLGFANKLIVQLVNNGQNIVFPRVVTGAQPTTGGGIKMTQDYSSTSTLWSPIESIVFTSALLPIQNEQQAPPNALGTKNTGNSAATSQSAFAPIITDVALDLSSDPSGYRKMIYYAPSAEYRMADFQNSKADIRSIDVNVFWRNRLDNNLYPLSMFNLSSVSIKLMFRKKFILGKSERNGEF